MAGFFASGLTNWLFVIPHTKLRQQQALAQAESFSLF